MKKDLTDKKFGKLTALSVISRTRNGHIRWQCKCDCGNFHQVLSTHLLSEKISHCGCDSHSGIKHQQWTGVGDISGDYYSAIKRAATKGKRRFIEFSVSLDYLWNLYLNQNKKCALSGVPLHFKHTNGIKVNNSQTSSLDRIDSSLGYIEGNVQWVHKDINLMKNRLDQNVFIEYCKSIARNN